MRRLVKILIIVSVVLAVLAATGAGLVIWSVQRAFPDYGGERVLPSLQADVTVQRDDHGIPHIWADTAEDLFKAQGYVHAQDRFWEMDFRRHVTAGRLSEWFGEDQVETDVFIRTMGWRRVAEEEYELLSADTRRYLQAYAEGVNAYLSERSGGELGLHYTVLGLVGGDYTPEPWSPVDSIAWLKAMAWDLRANMEDEISRSLLAGEVPLDRVEQLWPAYPYDRHDPIVSDADLATVAPAARVAPVTDPTAAEALVRVQQALDTMPVLLGKGNGIGSNSWVVDGTRTTTGRPMLVNDPHLGPSMPSLWYQIGLHCRERTDACPFEAAGYSFSGMPGVVIGHNDRIAWGFTNLNADVSDLYLEQVSGDSYLVPGGTEPLVTRQETIEVAGADDVVVTVRTTRHGPIVSDADDLTRAVGDSAPVAEGSPDRGDGYAVALRWTALDPGRTADAIFALNRARGWADFRAAAALFEVPAQNLVYADVDGHIGYQTPGRIPVRSDGADGRWPVPGWTGTGEWTSFIPFDALPSVLDPESGFVVTANNAVVSNAYPYLLTHDWDYGYRSQRIVDLLTEAGPLDADAMVEIQMDSSNGFADTLLPYLLDIDLPDGYYTDGQDLLRDWDGTQEPDSGAAAYFNAVWRQLLEHTFDDELPDDVEPDGGSRWFEVVRVLLESPNDPYWDNVDTVDARETREGILQLSMRDARDDLTRLMAKRASDWEWGRVHALTLTDQTFGTSGIGLIERLFNRGPYRAGGGTDIVQANAWLPADGFEVTAVPSMRMVVDLADFDASRWIDLTGVSGHPYHDHYADQTELWASGGTIPMLWSSEAVREAAEHTLRLLPAS